MRVRPADAIDLGRLSGAQGFVRVQTSYACQQSLTTQDLLNARNAAGEAVRSVEERRVGVRDLDASPQQATRHRRCARGRVALVEQRHGAPRPDSPLPQEAADDPALDRRTVPREPERRYEVA